MPKILELPDESVRLLRKYVSRVLPPAGHDTVFSRMALSAIIRRQGINKLHNADEAKKLGEAHCLLIEPLEDKIQVKVRGFTEMGLKVWMTLLVEGKCEKTCIDPAVLWTNRKAKDLSLSAESPRGTEIQTLACKQDGVSRRLRMLPKQYETLSKEFIENQPKQPAKFKQIEFLQKLCKYAGIAEHPSWVTLTSNGAVWKDGEMTCCFAGEEIKPVYLSPGTIRLLASLPAIETLCLDENSGSSSGVQIITFQREDSSFLVERISQEEASAYLKHAETPGLTKTVSIDKISRALTLATNYLGKTSLTASPNLSLGCYGHPNAIGIVGKGERSVVLASDGLAAKDYPEIIIPTKLSTPLCRLLRIYGTEHKTSEIEFSHNRIGESLLLDQNLRVITKLPSNTRKEFCETKTSATLGHWVMTPKWIQLCKESLECIKILSQEIPAVHLQLDNQAVLRIKTSEACCWTTEEIEEQKAVLLEIPYTEWLRTINLLARLKVDTLKVKLLRVGGGGLFLDLEVEEDSKTTTVIRIPYIRQLNEKIEVRKVKGLKPLPDLTDLKITLDTCALPIKDALAQTTIGMRMLRHALASETETLTSNRLCALKIKKNLGASGIVPRSLPLIQSILGDCEYIRYNEHIFQKDGLLLIAEPIEEERDMFPNIERILELKEEPIVKAIVTLSALLENLEDKNSCWLWHKSGHYLSLSGSPGYAEIEDWKTHEYIGIQLAANPQPILRTIKKILPDELILKCTLTATRLLLSGESFDLLFLLLQEPEINETLRIELEETVKKEKQK